MTITVTRGMLITATGLVFVVVVFIGGTEEKSSQLSEYKRQAPMVLTFPGK